MRSGLKATKHVGAARRPLAASGSVSSSPCRADVVVEVRMIV